MCILKHRNSKVCNGQYGEVAPPSPMPPSNYASIDVEEASYTNKPLHPENELENSVKPVIEPGSQSPSIPQVHNAENVTYGNLSVESQTTSKTVITSRQPFTPASRTSKFPVVGQYLTGSSPKPQSLSTRSSITRTTRQITHRSVTTQRPQITSTSRKPASISDTSRTIGLPSSSTVPVQPDSTKRPKNRLIQSSDCILRPSDTLFVVDSTSSVRQFFEDHRKYIIEIINSVVPEFDNETRIGCIQIVFI
uniref:VWFA domain-containing protein n=1 Tax=Elaeophora elaphi TaxID=1147741 RepID=A0A0R3S5D9_9BILA